MVDPENVSWRVRRWWWTPIPWETGFATLDMLILLIMLPFMVTWPLWLLAKWLGVSWTIVIERDGTEVGRERVRGWRASGQRMRELAESAEAGALAHLLEPTDTQ
ncbi:MAG: hypothetical protein U1D00_19290 [Mycobacterium sp.]|nr:hypothetical protein [Mycobacterium sp.]